MNILFLTETFPYPLDSGGKIVSYQVLRMLSKKHRIHLLSFAAVMPADSDRRAISSLGIKTTVVTTPKRSGTYKQGKTELLNALIRLQPFYLSLFYDRDFVEQRDNIMAREHFDVVHIDHLGMSQYLPSTKTQIWVCYEHNVEYRLSRDLSQLPHDAIRAKLFYSYNAVTLARYEKRVLRKFDQVIVPSENDKQMLRESGINGGRILVAPPFCKPQPTDAIKQNNELLFIGNLWWKPNLDAMQWFLRSVFPVLRREYPQIRLTVIGNGAEMLKNRQSSGEVLLLGGVSDVSPYLNRADIFIMPIRVGGGIRIKSLTAFSRSLPVVSTAIAMRGTNARPETEYLEADDARSFTDQILRLLRDKPLQKRLGRAALEMIRKRHDEKAVSQLLLSSYGKSDN